MPIAVEELFAPNLEDTRQPMVYQFLKMKQEEKKSQKSFGR